MVGTTFRSCTLVGCCRWVSSVCGTHAVDHPPGDSLAFGCRLVPVAVQIPYFSKTARLRPRVCFASWICRACPDSFVLKGSVAVRQPSILCVRHEGYSSRNEVNTLCASFRHDVINQNIATRVDDHPSRTFQTVVVASGFDVQ